MGEGFLEHLANTNNDANPELMRLALKLATGAGKTTVMAMLIAWQAINAARHPQSKNRRKVQPWRNRWSEKLSYRKQYRTPRSLFKE
jgi:hypothetical protein